MTAPQIREILEQYEKYLIHHYSSQPIPFSHHETDPTADEAHDHVMDMINRQLGWEDACLLTGKSNRWLGFIQGVLWANGEYTIDDLKNQNRPLKEELVG